MPSAEFSCSIIASPCFSNLALYITCSHCSVLRGTFNIYANANSLCTMMQLLTARAQTEGPFTRTSALPHPLPLHAFPCWVNYTLTHSWTSTASSVRCPVLHPGQRSRGGIGGGFMTSCRSRASSRPRRHFGDYFFSFALLCASSKK